MKIIRNIITRTGHPSGLYELVFDREYKWKYIRHAENKIDDMYVTIRKKSNGWTIPFSKEDLHEDNS